MLQRVWCARQAEVPLEEPEDLSDPMLAGERLEMPAALRPAGGGPGPVPLGAPEAQPPAVPIAGGAPPAQKLKLQFRLGCVG